MTLRQPQLLADLLRSGADSLDAEILAEKAAA